MARLIGPDFISIQVRDLEAARAFYASVVGLKVAARSPPGAVVFDTEPVPFAIREALVGLGDADDLGRGIALWFGCDDADAMHDKLVAHGAAIMSAPQDGPFGRYFAFRDPFGYAITAHTIPSR